jgi:H+-transporting ATPase
VHGSTDAARAAADIVLTQPGLSTIVNGMLISRRIFVRIKNFLTYRIAATLQLLIFFFIAVLALKPRSFMPDHWEDDDNFPDDHEWPEFFHMPVLMLMLITLLNDGTLIAIGYDRVQARDTPEKWNLTVLYVISSVLAGVALISSLILLYICLDSWNNGAFGGLSYGQITATIYLKVSISDFLTLFSARTNEDYFWTTAPAPILLGAAGFALTISTIIACTWPETYPDGVYTVGLARRQPYAMALYVWLYCIGWWIVQDVAKVYTFHVLKTHNYFGYNDTGKLVLPESTLKYIKDNKAKDMAPKKSAHH